MSTKIISSLNSVRPSSETISNQNKPSSINSSSDALSAADLIEAMTVRLVRLEQLEQENEILNQKLTSKENGHRDISRTRELLEEKQTEVQRLRERNAAMAERKFIMDQRRTENTLSSNRQSDLEREYKDDFRDGTRVDAIDTIEAKLSQHKKKGQSSITDQLQAYRLACFIFEISYEGASKARENFISYYSSVLETLVTEAPTVGSMPDSKFKKLFEANSSRKSTVSQDLLNEVMVLVKEGAVKHNLETLVKTVKKELKDKWKENGKKGEVIPNYDKNLKNDLKSYIEYCTQFAWRMVTQVPPLKVDYKSSTFNPSYHTKSQAFASPVQQSTTGRWVDSRERKQIKCYVWPALFDADNRVIEKGEVVLAEHSHQSS